jgi:hypothetical protein
VQHKFICMADITLATFPAIPMVLLFKVSNHILRATIYSRLGFCYWNNH